jgi:hypothetical protein
VGEGERGQVLDLDEIDAALDELVRREAERHGLGWGLP